MPRLKRRNISHAFPVARPLPWLPLLEMRCPKYEGSQGDAVMQLTPVLYDFIWLYYYYYYALLLLDAFHSLLNQPETHYKFLIFFFINLTWQELVKLLWRFGAEDAANDIGLEPKDWLSWKFLTFLFGWVGFVLGPRKIMRFSDFAFDQSECDMCKISTLSSIQSEQIWSHSIYTGNTTI